MSVQSFVLLYGLPFLVLSITAKKFALPNFQPLHRQTWLLLAWVAVGVVIRLPLLWDTGFHYDTGTYKAWALKLSDPAAPLHIYEEGYFADYPPLYMYVLAALGWFARQFGLDSTAHFTALIKLPALFCDLAVALLIYRHAPVSTDTKSNGGKLLLASLYWLNPAIIFDSALWGQTEAVLALLVVGAWLQWRTGRLWAASIALGAAVAFKPQGMVFAYVYGVAVLCAMPLLVTLRQALIGFVSFGLIILPFALDQNADWIFKLYFNTAATYDYLTVNAYNLWALLGWNWTKDAGQFLSLNAQIWAMLLAGGALTGIAVYSGLMLRRESDMQSRGHVMAWAFALAAMLFFMLAPRMHERYILSILPLLLLLPGAAHTRSLLVLWSIASLANLGYVYHHYVDLDSIAPANNLFIQTLGGLNCALAAYTLWARFYPSSLSQVLKWAAESLQRIPALPQVATPREQWTYKHALPYLILGPVALWLGSYQLGTKNYPLQGLLIEKPLEILYSYDIPVQPQRALIFAGQGEGKIVLEQKTDTKWESLLAETEIKEFYKLYELKLEKTSAAREFRLRVTSVERPLQLNELGLLGEHGETLVPQHVSSTSQVGPALFDEPATWIPDQGYLSSTFFDEIYHARTAHEYLHGLSIYETTHPPLGKWLISQGINTFGMTPWGMRIAGVMATVGIVLALIWGAWLIAGNVRAMWVVGLLGLFEFSRFSIGRYATIDSFLILFVLLSALNLWKAFNADRSKTWLLGWHLSPALLLAGLSLGAAIATKWNALYFGIALFGFYLYSLMQLGKSQASVKPAQVAPMLYGPAIALGLIPLAVYCLSYIPFLACLPHTPDLFSLEGLKQVWKSQVDMYDYHSKLESTHAFSSAYYTWPIALKPLWLYVSDAQAPLRSSITLMGNPAIWWSGLVAFIALCSSRLPWPVRDKVWLIGCAAALYIPWAAVSRASFIYHYYPIVPFLVLLIGVTATRLPQTHMLGRYLPWLLAATSAGLFALFYPAISGYWMPADSFKILHWLPSWWML